MRIHRIIVAALLIGTMTTQAGSQGVIPAVALGAAADNPETFVGVLAKLRVPAGLEIRNEDRPVTYSVKFGAKDGSVVPLGDVVDAFNRMHGDYRANICHPRRHSG